MSFSSLLRTVLFATLGLTTMGHSAEAAPPNVVFILADDLGFGDVGYNGATHVRTPNIDKLAAGGRQFTDAHSTSAVCTPSRYALLTGEYPLRYGGGKGVWGPHSPVGPLLIDTDTLTVGKALKRVGYRTACIGKWHLGFGKEGQTDYSKPLRPGPLEVGFDRYFGMPLVNSGSPYVLVDQDMIVGHDPEDPLVLAGKGRKPSPTPTYPPEAGNKSPNRFSGALAAHELFDDTQLATQFTEEAVKWIGENKDDPFFLYLPTTNIHHPFTPAPQFKGTSDCGLYGDFIHELDWMVGEVVGSLEEHGLLENTLVIFTSDNGGMINRGGLDAFKAGHRQNGDLLGFKFGVWEGGHRVPFVAHWPGKVAAGTKSDQLISHVDMLATLLALTGQDDAADLEEKDSVNLLEAFLGEPEEQIREELVIAPHKPSHLSLRQGRWMYIPARGAGGWTGPKPKHAWGGTFAASLVGSENSDFGTDGKYKPGAPNAQLYDLEADPNQTTNLYDQHPEVVSEMDAALKRYRPAQGKREKPKAPAKPKAAAEPQKASEPVQARADAPNIILINADDLGYGDLSCYGATKLSTPHIDRLAAEGRRFTDAHSASAVCSPSRYGLMTGQYPLRKNFWGPTPFTQELTLDPTEPNLASVLKGAGYDTAVIGKWHLGFGKGKADWNKPLKPGPLEVGFDFYFGMPTVNSGPPFVYVENHSVVGYDPADPFVMRQKSVTQSWPEKSGGSAIGGAEQAHLLYRDEHVGTTFAEKAVAWIRNRREAREKPFFLYLATTNIHHPFTPHPRFQGTSECGRYGDFVHELDWIVGEVLGVLDELEMAENTLVVFTSDNGGMLNNTGQKAWKSGHRQNGDLLGHKFGAWEGGHRVPFVVRWPGHVPAGTESGALVSQIDLLTTFAAAAGAVLPEDAVVDGVDQLAEFTGTAEKPARDLLVISPNSPEHLTIRKGDWVYIPSQNEGGFQGKKMGDHLFSGAASQALTELENSDVIDGRIRADAPPAQLYNLGADPRQASNVHNEHPEVVAELAGLVETWRTEIPDTPELGWINLKQKGGSKGKSKVAAKIPATPSKHSVCFDFESGELAPWKVATGELGHPVGSRETFFRSAEAYNKQGTYYLTTLEPSAEAESGADAQTGVIVSPLFVPKGGPMTFRIGGGSGEKTYLALCSEKGEKVLMARGRNDQSMYPVRWDLTPYAGQRMYLKVVDKWTEGWGHITVDHIEFDGEVLETSPAL